MGGVMKYYSIAMLCTLFTLTSNGMDNSTKQEKMALFTTISNCIDLNKEQKVDALMTLKDNLNPVTDIKLSRAINLKIARLRSSNISTSAVRLNFDFNN